MTAEQQSQEAIVLKDENGAIYAIPAAVLAQCRVPEEHTTAVEQAAQQASAADTQGHGYIHTYDKSGDFLGLNYTPLTPRGHLTIIRLPFDVPILTFKRS